MQRGQKLQDVMDSPSLGMTHHLWEGSDWIICRPVFHSKMERYCVKGEWFAIWIQKGKLFRVKNNPPPVTSNFSTVGCRMKIFARVKIFPTVAHFCNYFFSSCPFFSLCLFKPQIIVSFFTGSQIRVAGVFPKFLNPCGT